nr:hypothetical protein [Pseudomonas monteilii]
MSDTEADQSLATGHPMNADTWADFVTRLRHHCNGQGVKWHHTACALFTVQQKRIDYGYEADYAEGLVVCLEDRRWFSPEEYWKDLDEEEQQEINQAVHIQQERRTRCSCLEQKAREVQDLRYPHAHRKPIQQHRDGQRAARGNRSRMRALRQSADIRLLPSRAGMAG